MKTIMASFDSKARGRHPPSMSLKCGRSSTWWNLWEKYVHIWSIFGCAEMAPGFLRNSQVYSLYILYPVICLAFHFWNVKLNSHNHGNNTTQPLADALPPPPTASGDLEAQPYVQRCMVWLDGQKTGLDQLILINYLNLSHSLRGDFDFNSQVLKPILRCFPTHHGQFQATYF